MHDLLFVYTSFSTECMFSVSRLSMGWLDHALPSTDWRGFFRLHPAGTPQIQKVMTVMIRHHEPLFPPSKDVNPTPPPTKSKSKKSSGPRFVGWESAEVTAIINVCGDISCKHARIIPQLPQKNIMPKHMWLIIHKCLNKAIIKRKELISHRNEGETECLWWVWRSLLLVFFSICHRVVYHANRTVQHTVVRELF